MEQAPTPASQEATASSFATNDDDIADVAISLHANIEGGHAYENQDLAMVETMATQAISKNRAHM